MDRLDVDGIHDRLELSESIESRVAVLQVGRAAARQRVEGCLDAPCDQGRIRFHCSVYRYGHGRFGSKGS